METDRHSTRHYALSLPIVVCGKSPFQSLHSRAGPETSPRTGSTLSAMKSILPAMARRIVREELCDVHERKRIYHAAVQFLRLPAERWRWARKGPEKKPLAVVPAINSCSGSVVQC